MTTTKHTRTKGLTIGAIVLLLGFGAGFYAAKKLTPAQGSDTQSEHKNVYTVVHEVKRADGSTETTTETLDKSKESSRVIAVPPQVPVVTVSATASIDYRNLQPVYGVLLQKPFLNGKVEVGTGLNTQGLLMVTLGWSF